MPEGRRYSPENPSPAMKDFAQYIRDQGYPDVTDEAVACTARFHREWQEQHAERVRREREANAGQKEAEKAQKAQAKAEKKAQREAEKAQRDAEKEAKRQQKEAEKAAKAEQESQTTGDGSDNADSSEAPRKRLRLKKDSAEEVAGVSAGTF